MRFQREYGASATAMVDARSVVSRAAGHPTVRQFVRFAMVGVVGTIVHYGVLIALVEFVAMGVVLATSIGFLSGAVVSYGLNRKLTFVTTQPIGIAFVKYIVALSVGLVLNGGIVAVLEHWGLHYLIAQPIATGVVLFWNFGASRFLVFRT
jgi:putative flippase GtrA